MSATTTATRIQPDEALVRWLLDHQIDHDLHRHELAFTATATARAEGVTPKTFAKVVGVITDDGRRALLVVCAEDHVDLAKARRALSAGEVHLLPEAELEALAPRCEPGAIPAVGALYGVPMYADYAIRDDRDLSFNAGTHRCSVRVDRSAWERAAGVLYADLARVDDARPAWALS